MTDRHLTSQQADITPSRIEWRGPGGYTVVLDEDFVSLRGSGALEESEINTLIEVVNMAKSCRDAGAAPTPKRIEVPF